MVSRRQFLPYIGTEKQLLCVHWSTHKQQQFTCQADTIAKSSLTPSVALLVHSSGTVHSIVDCHVLTGSQK